MASQQSLFPTEPEVLTVSEVNGLVRELVEENFPGVTVTGEVSNFRRHSSGHLYFTLKDDAAQLRTVCFRSTARNINLDIADGMQLVVAGRLTVYEGYGQYQLIADEIEEAGQGDLLRAYRKLLAALEAEGLFDPEHKLELPAYPMRIAVVTSPTGAAIRDVLSTLATRWPCADVLMVPVRVQGELAPGEIVRALDVLSDAGAADVIILGRGGGSLEDLWAFNEEMVARAIHRCTIPIVSGVGHETDVTIADWVADARAATPTAAAQMVAPVREEVGARVDAVVARAERTITSRLALARSRLSELVRSYALGQVRSRIERALQTIDHRVDALSRVIFSLTNTSRARVEKAQASLDALNPAAILERGFTICADPETGRVIRAAGDALASGVMDVTFHDGAVVADVRKRKGADGR